MTIKIVTIGGGTGSFAILSELKKRKEMGKDIEISAIVAMSDSGGSSGILMDNYGVLPAGDIRQCLLALSPATESLRDLFLYRYEEGFLKGHSFGNLFISTLEKISGNLEKAIEESEKILNSQGKVYPVGFNKHQLVAELENGEKIISEKNLDNADLRNLKKIYFDKEVELNSKIPKILEEADLILVNPGSFYTSIIPNFLVKGLVHVLEKSSAKKVFITNIVTEKNQTNDFKVIDFLKELEKHTGFSDFDFILFNTNKELIGDEILERYKKEGKNFVKCGSEKNKNVKFIGGDFVKKPNINDKKHLIRSSSKNIIDNVFKIIEKDNIYIFDLDHTIINAKKFREDVGIFLENNPNILSEKIWSLFDDNNIELLEFIKFNIKKYYFDNILEKIKKIKGQKILLTFGDVRFQKYKVESLGIKEYFDSVIFTKDSKIEWLKQFYNKNKDKEIIFINDNYNKRFNENEEVRKNIPEIKVLEVDSYPKDNHISNILEKL